MKLVSCLQLFFLLEMFNAERITHEPKPGMSIPLLYHALNTEDKGSRSARRFFNATDTWGEGVHMANFTFYNPHQWFYMVFDTTTSNSWVYAKMYDFCDDLVFEVQKKHRLHDPFNSQRTYRADFYETRGGWVFGFETENNRLEFPEVYGEEPWYRLNMTFLEVKKASKSLIDQPFDAVIGLGPFSDIFKACEDWKKPNAIGLALPPMRFAQSSLKGELVICGTKPNQRKLGWPGTPTEVASSHIFKWQITCEKIHFNKFIAGSDRGIHEVGRYAAVTFDLNTPYLIMPQAALDKFETLVNVTKDPNTNELKVACENNILFPVLYFFINNDYSLHLTGDDYTLHKRKPDNTGEECQVLFKVSPKKEWIMGDMLMRKYFTLFYGNPHRMGFIEYA